MDSNIKKKLEEWVKDHYKQYSTGWTSERSAGNYDDCFNDGYELEQVGQHIRLVVF